jgi:hypothetical protein
MSPKKQPPQNIPAEVGASGLHRSSGYVQEEFLTELSGSRWKRVVRRMLNDPIIVAFNRCTEMLVRQVTWTWKAASDSPEDGKAKDFIEGAVKDMGATWADTVSEIVTFTGWGFELSEMVFKRRSGMNPGTYQDSAGSERPLPVSKFNDNLIGWERWAGRAQETIERWEFDDNGRATAAVQIAAPDWRERIIPLDKCLHFRTTANKGNPEGLSTCRGAYEPWYYKTELQRIEAIGVEKNLSGYPVIRVPQKVIDLGPGNAIFESWMKMGRDMRVDEQMFSLLPSDRWNNGQGEYMYAIELLSTSGRLVDTVPIIQRYAQWMLMTVMADFLLLGHEKVGSFALSSDKTNLFSVALGAYLDIIRDEINRKAVPKLLALNGMPLESAPELHHGDIESPDIVELSDAVSKLTLAGFTFTQEEADWVKKQAGFPVVEGGKGTPMQKPPEPPAATAPVLPVEPSPQGKQASEKGAVPSKAELDGVSKWWDKNAPEAARGLFDAKAV